ncbi:hypothetical protein [Pseudomonas sp. Q1-7]|uniref:hypothetical protein n=1 Tax=Pseudomonas sp. Q1-7 TaxID=3020843 RepID=UPI0023018722|nr:hypothetical protein [Pseudomonas sp. Q1-7]
MSSSDIAGASPESRHAQDDLPATERMRATLARQRPGAAPNALAGASSRAKDSLCPTSIIEVLQNLLDAAEQRNAEDSPSGIARHSRLGLSG